MDKRMMTEINFL